MVSIRGKIVGHGLMLTWVNLCKAWAEHGTELPHGSHVKDSEGTLLQVANHAFYFNIYHRGSGTRK